MRGEVKGGATTLGGYILNGGYAKTHWGKITKADFGYVLADNFCYLTGIEGYTKNDNNAKWITKIIQNIESKPTQKINSQGSIKINCDSPVWKKRPICS